MRTGVQILQQKQIAPGGCLPSQSMGGGDRSLGVRWLATLARLSELGSVRGPDSASKVGSGRAWSLGIHALTHMHPHTCIHSIHMQTCMHTTHILGKSSLPEYFPSILLPLG